ncbi:MAG: hypothetical protein ACU0BK_15890 [Shimia sp.]|uniref:hypothetical protein n=1 Tax=Shimia sp. TaxID=1954381 RepID=UPI004059CE9E
MGRKLESLDEFDVYLPPGTLVRHDGLVWDGGQPEFGVVVRCWRDHEMNVWDCYIAFWGNEAPDPTDTNPEKPYILRYASMSVTVVAPLLQETR